MSGVRPDVTKLNLHDEGPSSRPASRNSSFLRFSAQAAPPSPGPRSRSQSPPAVLAPNEPGPHWRVRNSTLGEHYADAKSHRHTPEAESPSLSVPGSGPGPTEPKPESENHHNEGYHSEGHHHGGHHSEQHHHDQHHHEQHLHDGHHLFHHHHEHPEHPEHNGHRAHFDAAPPHHDHLKTAASSASVSSMASGKSGRPGASVIELKRFFGKGRTKHDKPDNTTSNAGSSKKSTPKKTDKGLFGSLFSRNKSKRDKKKAAVFDLNSPDGPQPAAGAAGSSGSDTAKDPLETNPNFVIHAPDYESWDPFHIFGNAEEDGMQGDAAELLPFLESGITKYGEMGKDMGSGAGGNVRMMERSSDHKLFAVKEFRPRKQNESVQKYAKHVTAEYALGAAFHHKHIIETIDLIKEGDKYYEVMEYGPNDFFTLVMSGSMNTPKINSAFHQIVSGVCYLHSMGVAHRDLKLDNCVVTKDGMVKLIDFGSAVVFKYPMSPQIHLARGIMGSDPYLAPEVFGRKPYQPQCADIWSCGIIYCCTYLRRFPWKLPQPDDQSYRKFAENPENIDGQHPPQTNPRKVLGPWRLLRLLPAPSRRILARILSVEVAPRATMDAVLADPWFSKIAEISILPDVAPTQAVPGVAKSVEAHA